MELHQTLRGIRDQHCDVKLDLVGLSTGDRKKAKNFSLGMKQRLGIAITLLGNPELLILDEPINGLDPVGVKEIRVLLSQLCHEKKLTLLISSHNLPELHQIATQYIFIDNGKIIKVVSAQALNNMEKETLENYFLSLIGGGETIV